MSNISIDIENTIFKYSSSILQLNCKKRMKFSSEYYKARKNVLKIKQIRDKQIYNAKKRYIEEMILIFNTFDNIKIRRIPSINSMDLHEIIILDINIIANISTIYKVAYSNYMDSLLTTYDEDDDNFMTIDIQENVDDSITESLYWKWIGCLHMIKAFPGCKREAQNCIHYLNKAIQYSNIESAYILGLYYYHFCNNINKGIELFMMGEKQLHMKSILKLANHFTVKEIDYNKALTYYLIMIDNKYNEGIMHFVHRIEVYYPFLKEFHLHFYMKNPDEGMKQFIRQRLVDNGQKDECTICCHKKELYLHDCLKHSICLLCYVHTTNKCPQCRFCIYDIKQKLIDIVCEDNFDDDL